jgi:hypothetical protein
MRTMTRKSKRVSRGPSPTPENRGKTGAKKLNGGIDPSVGEATRFKPGESGNPGGRPRIAKLSEACRAKLGALVPDDAEGRTYAEAIAEKLVQLALKGDIRAAQELADRAEGRPSQMAPRTEYSGVKYIVLDMPRPQRGAIMPDVRPGQLSNSPPGSAKI